VRLAITLRQETRSLLNAETVLFIDDHKAKPGKLRCLGEEGMRPDDQCGTTVGDLLLCSPSLFGGLTPHAQHTQHAQGGKEAGCSCCVLPCKQLRWSKQGGLIPRACRHSCCNKSYCCLSCPNVALEEPHHRLGLGDGRANRLDRRRLVARPLRGSADRVPADSRTDALFNCSTQRRARLQQGGGSARHATASTDKCTLHGEQLVEGEATQCRITALKLLWPVQALDSFTKPHQVMRVTNLVREWITQCCAMGVKEGADCTPKRWRSDASRESVDRHNATSPDLCVALVR
jgi:hypothetical protein